MASGSDAACLQTAARHEPDEKYKDGTRNKKAERLQCSCRCFVRLSTGHSLTTSRWWAYQTATGLQRWRWDTTLAVSHKLLRMSGNASKVNERLAKSSRHHKHTRRKGTRSGSEVISFHRRHRVCQSFMHACHLSVVNRATSAAAGSTA